MIGDFTTALASISASYRSFGPSEGKRPAASRVRNTILNMLPDAGDHSLNVRRGAESQRGRKDQLFILMQGYTA